MMTNNNRQTFVFSARQVLQDALRFSHQAMATEFEIFVCHDDKNYAHQAAQAAFAELDRLELELSRFLENSDISRINNLHKNQSIKVGIDTFESLQQCQKIYVETNGAFDITIGSLLNTWLKKDKTLRSSDQVETNAAKSTKGMCWIELNETDYSVKLLHSPILLDLGGFGKGFALDKMVDIFQDWEIKRVLLHGGKSSVLALDAPPNAIGWPISVSNPFSKKIMCEIYLQNRAVSASGVEKGQHIIDPGKGEPIKAAKAAWAFAPQAALSDALSTAFMIMSDDEIKKYCEKHSGICALCINQDETLPIVQVGLL